MRCTSTDPSAVVSKAQVEYQYIESCYVATVTTDQKVIQRHQSVLGGGGAESCQDILLYGND
jgi:hypothetical protein